MSRTRKTSWLLWSVFGMLIVFSALSLLHAFAIVGLTPMMVYDSAEAVPKLPDNDFSALFHSVSRYTGRVASYSSATVTAWVLFSGFLLFRDRRLNNAGSNNEKSS